MKANAAYQISIKYRKEVVTLDIEAIKKCARSQVILRSSAFLFTGLNYTINANGYFLKAFRSICGMEKISLRGKTTTMFSSESKKTLKTTNSS